MAETSPAMTRINLNGFSAAIVTGCGLNSSPEGFAVRLTGYYPPIPASAFSRASNAKAQIVAAFIERGDALAMKSRCYPVASRGGLADWRLL